MGQMKLFATTSIASLIVLLTLALHRPAEAQGQPCVWGEPTWTATSDQWGSTTRISVGCNGGITKCQGKLLVSFWILDEEGEWVIYEPPGMDWEEIPVTRVCGSAYVYSEMILHSKWPAATYCCVSFDFQQFDGYTYSTYRWKDHVFETP